jgi:hypothetical protein
MPNAEAVRLAEDSHDSNKGDSLSSWHSRRNKYRYKPTGIRQPQPKWELLRVIETCE